MLAAWCDRRRALCSPYAVAAGTAAANAAPVHLGASSVQHSVFNDKLYWVRLARA